MHRFTKSAAHLVIALVSFPAFAQISDEQAEAAIREIQESHIVGNVPVPADFDRFLRRDLHGYFSSGEGSSIAVEYELLRKEPTQAGIAFPKYFAWVSVKQSGRDIKQGAVRLAAVQRERFEVTDFVSDVEIRRDPAQLRELFPLPLIGHIEERARDGK